MSSESNNKSQAYSRTLSHAIQRMHMIRSDVLSVKIQTGSVDRGTHADFEEAVLTMYYELKPYALNNPKAGSIWEENNLNELPDKCGQVKTVPAESGRGGISMNKTETTIVHADISVLLKVSEVLDDICHKLGFAPDADKETRIYKLTQEDYDEPVKEGIPKPK